MSTAQDRFAARLADWRCRQVVYQVFVDRFAIGRPLEPRRSLYAAPRVLRGWSDRPTRDAGKNPDLGVRGHELHFWGGDLQGVRDHLDHLRALGADVLYLNPIFEAFTNHKYDTTDWTRVDPQFGTEADLAALCDDAHARGLRVILDGVFNHSGAMCPYFQAARRDPTAPARRYYTFDDRFPAGWAAWRDAPNLPELRLEEPAVAEALWRADDSIVRRWLRHADGWRLDVACDLGPTFLAEITEATHAARPGSLTIGELYNWPAGWFPAVDGAMNLPLRSILVALAQGRLDGPHAGTLLATLVADAGIEPLLRSWNVLANHDLPRLAHLFPDRRDRVFLWSLLVAVPGAPLLYQGEELGFTGGDDPACREPMDWDRVATGTFEMGILRDLIEIRRSLPALQVGDLLPVPTRSLLAFVRHTDRPAETVVVVANPTHRTVCEPVCPRAPFLLDAMTLQEARTGATLKMASGFLWPDVPPRTVQLWSPAPERTDRYRFLKRVP